MMGQPNITLVTQHKYLGVELDSKLTWNDCSLGFLKTNLCNCPAAPCISKVAEEFVVDGFLKTCGHEHPR